MDKIASMEKWLRAAKRLDDSLKSDARKKAVEDLREFLKNSEGAVAIHHLLRATSKHIVFGKSHEAHPGLYPTVYALKGGIDGGLIKTSMATSAGITSVDYPQQVPASPEEVINAAIVYAGIAPHKIMTWLRNELDKIADSIP